MAPSRPVLGNLDLLPITLNDLFAEGFLSVCISPLVRTPGTRVWLPPNLAASQCTASIKIILIFVVVALDTPSLCSLAGLELANAAQAGLTLVAILLLQPPDHWDYKSWRSALPKLLPNQIPR